VTVITSSGVRLSFGKTVALADLSVSLSSGSIIGIAGPNGAGKSTFTRILAGEARSDQGFFTLDGQPWDPSTDMTTTAVVHQEPQVWLNLTVRENLVVGQESTFGRRRGGASRVDEILESLDIANLADVLLEKCSMATRQRVEIGRAMLRQAKCYIFDEPNSALTEAESDALFLFMRRLAETGHVTMLISHRLNDLVDQCQQVHVIRDGRLASTIDGDRLTENNIAAELVEGTTSLAEPGPTRASHGPNSPAGGFVLVNWESESGAFQSTGLELRPGDVTVVVGVEGSGGREFVASVAGFHKARGMARLLGVEAFRIERSTAFLPCDRRGMLFANLTVGDNVTVRLGAPEIATRGLGWLKRPARRRIALDAIDQFRIKTDGPAQPLVALSGGNQQKVALATALTRKPRLLAVEEPTRGVDVASKRDIYAILRRAAASGVTVLLFCTEIPEAYEVADRILVMDRGAFISDVNVSDYPDVIHLARALAVA